MCDLGLTRGLRVGLWLLLCVLTLIGVTFGAFYWLPATEQYFITERYLFSTDRHDASVYLVVLLPRNGPYQQIGDPSIQWRGSTEIEESQYLKVLSFSGSLASGSNQEAIIEYEVNLPQGNVSWQAPVEQFQRTPQKNVESDHELIQETADRLAQGTSRADVGRIQNFTCQHLIPAPAPTQFTKASALRAFNTGIGCCGEYANLMVALCRAAGIPAQTVIGLLLPDLPPYSIGLARSIHRPGEPHAWVEFQTDSGWELADPSCGKALFGETQLGRSDGRHLSFGEAGNLAMVYEESRRMVTDKGELISEELAAVKYVATADAFGVSITPSITLKKGWDGRWTNLLVAWLVTIILIWQLNLRQVQRHFSS